MLTIRCRYVLFRSITSTVEDRVRTVRMASDEATRKIQSHLKDIFAAGVSAVLPQKLIENRVRLKFGKYLCIDDQSFSVQDGVYVVGFGKAVMPMAIALEKILGERIREGIISVPPGSVETLSKLCPDILLKSKMEFCEGGLNNQPDVKSFKTTQKIVCRLQSLTNRDTVIVLISGGGSALLVQPKFPITLHEKQELCQKLQNAGADISELNTIRIALSDVKGGGLARIAHPGWVISLILSDVVGDPMELIASGPTVYHENDPNSVKDILQKYSLWETLSDQIKQVILTKNSKDTNINKLSHVTNFLIGNNMTAIEGAKQKATNKGLYPVVLSNSISGNVRLVSEAYADFVSCVCDALDGSMDGEEFLKKVQEIPVLEISESTADELWKTLCRVGCNQALVLIGGGEPTVEVRGTGKGGRNQELALAFSLDWCSRVQSRISRGVYHVVMLSAGTDGQDGPTDAAGAFGYPEIGPIILNVRLKLLDAKKLTEGGLGHIDLNAIDEFKEFQNSVNSLFIIRSSG